MHGTAHNTRTYKNTNTHSHTHTHENTDTRTHTHAHTRAHALTRTHTHTDLLRSLPSITQDSRTSMLALMDAIRLAL